MSRDGTLPPGVEHADIDRHFGGDEPAGFDDTYVDEWVDGEFYEMRNQSDAEIAGVCVTRDQWKHLWFEEEGGTVCGPYPNRFAATDALLRLYPDECREHARMAFDEDYDDDPEQTRLDAMHGGCERY